MDTMFALLGKLAFLGAVCIVHLTWSLRDATSHTQTIFNQPLSRELIDHINKINTTWKAGVNFVGDNETIIYQLTVMHPRRQSGNKIHKLPFHDDLHLWGQDGDAPVNFDARAVWPNCTTIGRVQDQGSCKSGWAIAATEAMTDRYCTLSKGKDTYVNISTEDVISCCGSACGDGCDGGFATAVWHYWVNTGIVTGGLYNTSAGCKPYTFKTCQHRLQNSLNTGLEPQTTALPPCDNESITPVCSHKCQKEYSIPYKEDLHFGKTAYAILPNVSQIQAEIFNHGPVQADMTVYADFFSYKTGLFKILLGKNECGIEGNVLAGTPKT